MTGINRISIKSPIFLFYFPELEKYDLIASVIAQSVARQAGSARKNIKFFVDKKSVCKDSWAFVLFRNENRPVILSKHSLRNPYLDVIIAHEIGHIVLNHMKENHYKDELEAFQFAAEVCGRERTIQAIQACCPPDRQQIIRDLRGWI